MTTKLMQPVVITSEHSLDSPPLFSPVIVSIEDFLNQELPERKLLMHPWLLSQGLAMIHAYRGIGKTHLALAIAYAVASGTSVLGWRCPAPAGVLLLDGEMPGPALQERLAGIVASSERDAQAAFRIMTPDLQSKDRPPFNLALPEDQLSLEPLLEGVSLIVVDNLATLCRTGKTNDSDSWLPVQEWALRQRAAGRSVLFIHHSGKNGTQRGTSAKEDVLDTVIGLRRPSDYQTAEGARFEIHFEKARGFSGQDSEAIEATLTFNADGLTEWSAKPVEDAIYERVIELAVEGLNQTEIGVEVDRHKSNVSRMMKRAREEGRLK